MDQAEQLSDSTGAYEQFVESLRDPELPAVALSPHRFSEALDIDMQTLARNARVHRNTVSRAPASHGIQTYLRESLRVLRAAADVGGDFERAMFWYRNEPLPPFGYRTAERLVSEGRTDDVIRYVESLGAGAAG